MQPKGVWDWQIGQWLKSTWLNLNYLCSHKFDWPPSKTDKIIWRPKLNKLSYFFLIKIQNSTIFIYHFHLILYLVPSWTIFYESKYQGNPRPFPKYLKKTILIVHQLQIPYQKKNLANHERYIPLNIFDHDFLVQCLGIDEILVGHFHQW